MFASEETETVNFERGVIRPVARCRFEIHSRTAERKRSRDGGGSYPRIRGSNSRLNASRPRRRRRFRTVTAGGESRVSLHHDSPPPPPVSFIKKSLTAIAVAFAESEASPIQRRDEISHEPLSRRQHFFVRKSRIESRRRREKRSRRDAHEGGDARIIATRVALARAS